MKSIYVISSLPTANGTIISDGGEYKLAVYDKDKKTVIRHVVHKHRQLEFRGENVLFLVDEALSDEEAIIKLEEFSDSI